MPLCNLLDEGGITISQEILFVILRSISKIRFVRSQNGRAFVASTRKESDMAKAAAPWFWREILACSAQV